LNTELLSIPQLQLFLLCFLRSCISFREVVDLFLFCCWFLLHRLLPVKEKMMLD
tara:strand:+ start:59326 stop:59487 length:162 start_codon:yes stop_codon:yes gene_type:complete